MKSKFKAKREKTLAVITALILMAAFAYTSIFEPLVNNCKQRQQEILALKTQLMKIQKDLLIKSHVEQRFEQVKSLLRPANSTQQQISQFSTDLNSIYEKIPVQIKSIKIMPTVEDTYYQTLYIKIEFTGRIKEILKLISDIESSEAPIRITQTKITARQITDDVSATLIINKIVDKS